MSGMLDGCQSGKDIICKIEKRVKSCCGKYAFCREADSAQDKPASVLMERIVQRYELCDTW